MLLSSVSVKHPAIAIGHGRWSFVVVAAVLAILGSCSPISQRDNVTERRAVKFDTSPPLSTILPREGDVPAECDSADCGTSPEEAEAQAESGVKPMESRVPASGWEIEQTQPGVRMPMAKVESFDGLGVGFTGPQGTANLRNPSDNALAVGPDHIVQIVNSRMAVYTKKGARFDSTGKVLYGPVRTNMIFEGFGGQCEQQTSGDSVVRYDQLAGRWLYVLPIFRRPAGKPDGPFYMCYAVSSGSDPLGPYHRYAFERPLFPDYPRPAIWPDGYYIPTSTGDEVIQKHACVADRQKMLKGLPATEQCVIIDGVNFLNNADIDGPGLPPPGAPNIMLAAGGTQLKKVFEDDGIYAYQFHVDWQDAAKTKVKGPVTLKVAPYHYLCDGQLTDCVPQPGTQRRLDAQGDKLMQRLVYRNLGTYEALAVVHSVNTKAGGGGVRWYEFRLDQNREPQLHQQGTYAPDKFYRWMGSIGIDRQGNIGVGYSFGGTPNFAGQRFAGRLATDTSGSLTFRETVLADGRAAQTNTKRWQDYTTTAMDPSDDCSFWYVGDYLKAGSESYSTSIGSFRMPGCLQSTLSGTAYFDRNHNGVRDNGEPGLAGVMIRYLPDEPSKSTDKNGDFKFSVPADPAYGDPTYTISEVMPQHEMWERTGAKTSLTARPAGRPEVANLDFGNVCLVRSGQAKDRSYWSKPRNGGGPQLEGGEWQMLLSSKLSLLNPDESRFTVSASDQASAEKFRRWLKKSRRSGLSGLSAQLAVAGLNVAQGSVDRHATVRDPVEGSWIEIDALLDRVSTIIAAKQRSTKTEQYRKLLEDLNRNQVDTTPSVPEQCKGSNG